MLHRLALSSLICLLVGNILQAETSDSLQATPFWHYSQFGGQMGHAGSFVLDTGNGPEIFCGANIDATNKDYLDRNDFWYVLGWNPATSSFEHRSVVPPILDSKTGGYKQFIGFCSAQITGDSTPEVVVGYMDGTVIVYNAITRQPVVTLYTRPQNVFNYVFDFTAADLDGDGTAELITFSQDRITVHDASGHLQWSVTGVNNGSLTVGQVDNDAAKEIVLSRGQVIDCATHAIQSYSNGNLWTGVHAVDLDGDGRDEIVAELYPGPGYGFSAIDILNNRVLWTKFTNSYVSSLRIANIDEEPGLELVCGTFTDPLRVFDVDRNGATEQWQASVPGWAVSTTLTGDLTGDGVKDLLWSSVRPDSSSDIFFCVRTDTKAFQGSPNAQALDGPFLPPVIGDITGDGVPEIVTASNSSHGGNSSGRLVVFDARTLTVLAMSEPLDQGAIKGGIGDLKLRDINSDGTKEIIVAADHLGAGDLRVLRFQPFSKTFETVWENPNKPASQPYSRVDMVDVDGDGNREFVVLNKGGNNFLTIIGYPSGSIKWKSPQLSSNPDGFTSMAIGDVDGDGQLEAVVAGASTDLKVIDLRSRTVEFSPPLADPRATAVAIPGIGTDANPCFIAGTSDGKLVRYEPVANANNYEATSTSVVSTGSISSLLPGAGDALWIGTKDQLQYRPNWYTTTWATEKRAPLNGSPVLLWTEAGPEIFCSYGYGVSAFQIDADVFAPPPQVSLSVMGELTEGSKVVAAGQLRREGPTNTALHVFLRSSGTASAADISIPQATLQNNTTWKMIIPEGETTLDFEVTIVDDGHVEGPEQLTLSIEESADYTTKLPGTGTIVLNDNEPAVGISAITSSIREDAAAQPAFTLFRTGDLTKSLEVSLVLEGTAQNGMDYLSPPHTFVFPADQDLLEISLIARIDNLVENPESIQFRLSPTSRYGLIAGSESAHVDLLDTSSTVGVGKFTRTNLTKGEVVFTRSGAESEPLTVFFLENRVWGRQRSQRRSITFGAGATEVRYQLKCLVVPYSGSIEIQPSSSYLISTGSLSYPDPRASRPTWRPKLDFPGFSSSGLSTFGTWTN